jgi:uncharacterized membrane protein (TIGR02234 family)
VRSGREYGLALLGGAVGGGVVLLAVRQQWAQAVFTPPKPLSPQVIDVSGGDLVPLAGALGITALACLAAVIATRGAARRVAGALLAALGAGAGVVASVGVTTATVLNVAAGKVGSPGAAAVSGAAGSTTSGSAGGSGVVSVVGSAKHAVMTGTPWRLAVLAGALLIVASGIATAWRGTRWPVMSARYDLPERPKAAPAGDTAAPAGDAAGPADDAAALTKHTALPARDSASMWESLTAGVDPTDVPLRRGGPRRRP